MLFCINRSFKTASVNYDLGIPMDEVVMDYVKTELKGVVSAENYGEAGDRITIIKGLPSAWNVSVFSDAFTFALLIIILTCKPTGLFGEKATDKV